VTLERRVRANGDVRIVCTECPLCGESLQDLHPLALHIRRSCPARERFRRPGALYDGGPDPVATDGGETNVDWLASTGSRPSRRDRRGDGVLVTGKIEELLEAADDRGSLTASEIAAILDTRELPAEVETDVRVAE
jgi:hypothetical protein